MVQGEMSYFITNVDYTVRQPALNFTLQSNGVKLDEGHFSGITEKPCHLEIHGWEFMKVALISEWEEHQSVHQRNTNHLWSSVGSYTYMRREQVAGSFVLSCPLRSGIEVCVKMFFYSHFR